MSHNSGSIGFHFQTAGGNSAGFINERKMSKRQHLFENEEEDTKVNSPFHKAIRHVKTKPVTRPFQSPYVNSGVNQSYYSNDKSNAPQNYDYPQQGGGDYDRTRDRRQYGAEENSNPNRSNLQNNFVHYGPGTPTFFHKNQDYAPQVARRRSTSSPDSGVPFSTANDASFEQGMSDDFLSAESVEQQEPFQFINSFNDDRSGHSLFRQVYKIVHSPASRVKALEQQKLSSESVATGINSPYF
jgi:hypothetical protein